MKSFLMKATIWDPNILSCKAESPIIVISILSSRVYCCIRKIGLQEQKQ